MNWPSLPSVMSPACRKALAAGEPDPINHFLNAGTRSSGGVRTQNFQISQSAQIIIKGRAFKNRADLLKRISALCRHIIPANRDLAPRGPYLAKHHTDGGAFSSAIVAEQTVNLSGGNLERYILNGDIVAETLLHIAK